MDKFGFEDGDIVVVNEHWIIIYAGYCERLIGGRTKHAITFYCISMLYGGYFRCHWPASRTGIGYFEDFDKGVRVATNSEKSRFYNKMVNNNMMWDYQNNKMTSPQ